MTDMPEDRAVAREAMVEGQLRRRGIADQRILDAFRAMPREVFVRPDQAAVAYDDGPLPIGEGQTISQPYVVALMVEALEVRPTDRVLEVGAGSGYAAAILGRLAGRVFAIERHERLAAAARERLRALGVDTVEVRAGDGTQGLPDEAPFDAILVSAGGPDVPAPLLEQLAPRGRLVIPVGRPREQRLVRVAGHDREWRREDLGPVAFVPLVGAAGWHDG